MKRALKRSTNMPVEPSLMGALAIAREFKAGRSFVGLARKYGMTALEAQAQVRKVMRDNFPKIAARPKAQRVRRK